MRGFSIADIASELLNTEIQQKAFETLVERENLDMKLLVKHEVMLA